MALALPLPTGAAASDPCPARILIVDDSAVARAVIERIVACTDRYAVTASVSTVPAALTVMARERVDFVLLDVQLPGVDGITALPDLIAAGQGAKVVIVSGMASDGASTTVQALAMGAADTLFKPAAGQRMHQFGEALIDKLDRLASPGRVFEVAPPTPTPVRAAQSPMPAHADYDVVAIGASTGGIHALSQLLRAIPSEFRLPIIVTQHLPTSFMPYFAAQLALIGGRPCDVAVDRMRLRPGRIVVAPGDAHIRCVALPDGAGAIRLSADPSISGCMPSVDPMFASMAAVFGERMLAIVLSGMGRDGLEGARRVHEAGGCVVVQDQESSVIWGMPGAVAFAGVADAIMTPEAIGSLAAHRRRP